MITVLSWSDVGQPSQAVQKENQSLILFTTNEARTVGEVALTRKEGLPHAEHFDIHMLYPKVAQSEELTALSKEFKDYIRNTVLDIDHPERASEDAIPGVTQIASYVGSESCAQCHVEETKIWEKSGHAHAFQSLVYKDSEADPTCIGCHTVGFGEPSGYRRAFGDTKFINVGCESCHGPGSEHVAQWKAGRRPSFKFRPLGPGDCKSCHYGEFSRPFDWDLFWPQIAHGKKTKS